MKHFRVLFSCYCNIVQHLYNVVQNAIYSGIVLACVIVHHLMLLLKLNVFIETVYMFMSLNLIGSQ